VTKSSGYGKHEQGLLTLSTTMGIVRGLDLLSGEQLPRIC
jgi:hypothetical protein